MKVMKKEMRPSGLDRKPKWEKVDRDDYTKRAERAVKRRGRLARHRNANFVSAGRVVQCGWKAPHADPSSHLVLIFWIHCTVEASDGLSVQSSVKSITVSAALSSIFTWAMLSALSSLLDGHSQAFKAGLPFPVTIADNNHNQAAAAYWILVK